MSHITLANRGLAAVNAKSWDEAVTTLSKALQTSTNPAWLIARSKALVGLGRFAEALDDANLAWHTAYERNRRPLMVEAHYRRAVALLRMGRLADADCCCLYAMRLIKGFPAKEKEDPTKACVDATGRWTATLQDAMDEARQDDFNQGNGATGMNLVTEVQSRPGQVAEWRLASTLRMQILRALEALATDDPARKPTVSMVPEKKELAAMELAAAEETGAGKPAADDHAPPRPAVSSDAAPRTQYFQSKTAMSVSVFSKGTSKERLKVEFLPSAVQMGPLVYPSGEEKDLRLELWGGIVPSSCKYIVTPNKVEMSLAKEQAGLWPQITRDSTSVDVSEPAQKQPGSGVETNATPADPPKPADAARDAKPAAAATGNKPTAASRPAYPSSSRTGPKDWDKIGADDDEEDGSDVNFFFKKLYKGATPEQQRAMMKSFTESNGTSLSTDWNDVKDRKVDTVPPEGVEAKKWS